MGPRPVTALGLGGNGLSPGLERALLIAVALPQIIEEFDASVTAAGWLVIGYLITMAALQPVGGKLGDRFGRRWHF